MTAEEHFKAIFRQWKAHLIHQTQDRGGASKLPGLGMAVDLRVVQNLKPPPIAMTNPESVCFQTKMASDIRTPPRDVSSHARQSVAHTSIDISFCMP